MKPKSEVPVTREQGRWPSFGAYPLSALHREIDRLFDDFSWGAGFRGLRKGELTPRMNVSETDGEIEFTAELPGLKAEDVEVTVADNVLTIRGEKKSEKEEAEADYRLMERSFGSFTRSFEVPGGVEPSAIAASIENGVLTVRFPKPAAAEARRIEVKSAA